PAPGRRVDGNALADRNLEGGPGRFPPSSGWPADASEDQGDEEQHQENHKQNPRNLRGRVVDAEEPHRAGDQRDDQKNDRPSQHGTSSSPGGLFTPPTNGCFVANAMPTVPSAAARAGVVSPGCFVRMRTPAPARVAYSSRASPAERTVMLPLTIVDPLASSP